MPSGYGWKLLQTARLQSRHGSRTPQGQSHRDRQALNQVTTRRCRTLGGLGPKTGGRITWRWKVGSYDASGPLAGHGRLRQERQAQPEASRPSRLAREPSRAPRASDSRAGVPPSGGAHRQDSCRGWRPRSPFRSLECREGRVSRRRRSRPPPAPPRRTPTRAAPSRVAPDPLHVARHRSGGGVAPRGRS
jgi:hypothetical protein